MSKELLTHAAVVAQEFSKTPRDTTIRVVSHYDCDGIASCAVLLKALNRDNRKYSISILKQIDEQSLQKLAAEDYSYYVFTDLGSGSYPLIEKYLSSKTFFILDHHELEGCSVSDKHLNPHFFGIDGSQGISGAGITYLFARALDPANVDIAHIAIVGAIGDVQAAHGFSELNKMILNDAVAAGKMHVVRELNIYGRETRPLYKALEYCSDPFIPGVSGNESGAFKLLSDAGIHPKRGTQFKKYIDLTSGEKQRLASQIILRRLDEENPEAIFGESYILSEEKAGTPLRDAKEFSTVLNACGRMGKASLGIGACLGIETMRRKALQNLQSYRGEIVKGMRWYENSDPSSVIRGDGYLIINARDEVMSTIIGTMASMISKSGNLDDGTFILSLARTDDDRTKVSLRVAGIRQQNVDLRSVIAEICSIAGGEFGGHTYAAGAVLPIDIEENFISVAKDVLAKRAVEEFVE